MARRQTVTANVPGDSLGVLFNPTPRFFLSVGALIAALLKATPIPADVVVSPAAGGGFTVHKINDLSAIQTDVTATGERITTVLPAGARNRFDFTGASAGAINPEPLGLADFIDRLTDGAYDVAALMGSPFEWTDGDMSFIISQTDGECAILATATLGANVDAEFVTVSPEGDIWEG